MADLTGLTLDELKEVYEAERASAERDQLLADINKLRSSKAAAAAAQADGELEPATASHKADAQVSTKSKKRVKLSDVCSSLCLYCLSIIWRALFANNLFNFAYAGVRYHAIYSLAFTISYIYSYKNHSPTRRCEW